MANQIVPMPNFEEVFVGLERRITVGWRQFLLSVARAINGIEGYSVGDTKMGLSATIPDGWLRCEGQAISREIYADLFALIDTTWGAGDGSTTFNLPDFRDRTPVGVSGTKLLGSYGGAASVTLNTGQLPAHNHGINDPGHDHSISVNGFVDVSPGTGYGVAANAPGSTGASYTGIATQNTGSGNPVPTQSPYAAVYWLIKF